MGRYVAEALESVGRQSYKRWEIIVVDDCGPADGTKEAVEAFAKQFPGHRVELIRHERNQGVSAARNNAVKASTGEYLAFLDPDDLWEPEKLEKQIRILQNDNDVAMVYSMARIRRLVADISFHADAECFGVAPVGDKKAGLFSVASGQNVFAFSTLVLRRSAFLAVKGFQEGLPFQNEDRLLIGCCAWHGNLAWVPEPLCVYRIHEGSATATVVKLDLAALVEFDLVYRIALWVRRQPGSRNLGARIVRHILRPRLSECLGSPSWYSFRKLLFDQCARLTLAYPENARFVLWRLFTKCPIIGFVRALIRAASGRANAP